MRASSGHRRCVRCDTNSCCISRGGTGSLSFENSPTLKCCCAVPVVPAKKIRLPNCELRNVTTYCGSISSVGFATIRSMQFIPANSGGTTAASPGLPVRTTTMSPAFSADLPCAACPSTLISTVSARANRSGKTFRDLNPCLTCQETSIAESISCAPKKSRVALQARNCRFS